MRITIDDLPKNRVSLLFRALVAGTLIALLAMGWLMWRDRFQYECRNETTTFAVLGIEQNGEELVSFAGTNFLATLHKMGLSFKGGSREARERFADYYFADTDRAGEVVNVPFVWIYARGNVDEMKTAGYKSFGKAFFDREKFAFSIVDPATRFAMQLDPESFTVFHSKTGDAIAAMPLPVRPVWSSDFGSDFSEHWLLRVEAKDGNGAWQKLDEFECRFVSQNFDIPPELYGMQKLTDDERAQSERLPVPAMTAVVKSIAFPRDLRSFSMPQEMSAAFGKMEIELAGTENFYNWRLGNFALGSAKTLREATGAEIVPADVLMFAPTDPQQICLTAPDRFHVNVRFLENEEFGTLDGNVLSTPIAKVAFPRENDEWAVLAKLVKMQGFGANEILPEQKLKLGKAANTRVSFAGQTCRMRAFLDDDYFRILKKSPPAIVIEITELPMLAKEYAPELFFVPANVRTDSNEILVPESVVIVRPGVYQYWFMPLGNAKEVFVMLGVSRIVEASGFVVPEIEN